MLAVIILADFTLTVLLHNPSSRPWTSSLILLLGGLLIFTITRRRQREAEEHKDQMEIAGKSITTSLRFDLVAGFATASVMFIAALAILL